MEFISSGVDRFSMLKEILKEAGLDYSIVEMDESCHFFVAPALPKEKYLQQTPTILVAHYDRA